jgi:hypothetical protein
MKLSIQFFGTLSMLLLSSISLSANTSKADGGMSPMTKLKVQIGTLEEMLNNPLYSKLTNVESSKMVSLIQKDISKKKAALKVLALKDKVEFCDYSLATKPELTNKLDPATNKSYKTLIEEERAIYAAQLELAKAEEAAQ